MSLVQMTVSGGAFILFIAAVRALALHRLPKGAFPALWEMAALQLLLPFTIPLPLGVFAPANDLPIVGAYLAAGGGFAPDTPPGGISAGTPALAGTAPSAVLPMVWLAGAALMAAYFTASYVRARRRFGCSTPDNTPAVRRWLAERTLRRPLEVRRSALASSPLTYGVLHPVILLPEDMERGGDALTLINMEEARSFSPYNHFSKLAIEERIEAIMKYKKASVLAVALAIALVVGATTAFAASAQPDAAPDGGAGFLGAGTAQ